MQPPGYWHDMDESFPFSHTALEWVNPYPSPDVRAYVETTLDRMEAIGAEVFIFCYDSGGLPL